MRVLLFLTVFSSFLNASYQAWDSWYDQRKYGSELIHPLCSPIAKAVLSGDAESVKKELSKFSSEDINKPTFVGVGQAYTLAHIAMNPSFITDSEISRYNIAQGNTAGYIAVVKLLGENGADFNLTTGRSATKPEEGIRYSHPFASYPPDGRFVVLYNELKAVALLYGADPYKRSSFFTAMENWELYISKCGGFTGVYDGAIEYLQAMIAKKEDTRSVAIHPNTQAVFKEMFSSKNLGEKYKDTKYEDVKIILEDISKQLEKKPNSKQDKSIIVPAEIKEATERKVLEPVTVIEEKEQQSIIVPAEKRTEEPVSKSQVIDEPTESKNNPSRCALI